MIPAFPSGKPKMNSADTSPKKGEGLPSPHYCLCSASFRRQNGYLMVLFFPQCHRIFNLQCRKKHYQLLDVLPPIFLKCSFVSVFFSDVGTDCGLLPCHTLLFAKLWCHHNVLSSMDTMSSLPCKRCTRSSL